MNILLSKWVPLLGAIGAIALFGFPAYAASDLITANGVTAPVFAAKDKVCVVSQMSCEVVRTKLILWVQTTLHEIPRPF